MYIEHKVENLSLIYIGKNQVFKKQKKQKHTHKNI